RVSSAVGWKRKSPQPAAAPGGGRRHTATSLGVDGQDGLVQLQDGQVDGGDEHRADVTTAPGAVRRLTADQFVELALAVLRPGQRLALVLGEELLPAVVAQQVHRLGVVVV